MSADETFVGLLMHTPTLKYERVIELPAPHQPQRHEKQAIHG